MRTWQIVALTASLLAGPSPSYPVPGGQDIAARRGRPELETHFAAVDAGGRLHPYRVFFPAKYGFAPAKVGGAVTAFPLVVACHPGGGDEHSYFEWKGNADRIQTIAEERGYIVACPAGPENNWHRMDAQSEFGVVCKDEAPVVIMKVVEELIRQRHVDETRIYLMGASSGAFATYATAARNPGIFAAIAGVCGGFEKALAPGLAKTPALMFNAVKDRRILIDKVRESAAALKAAGGVLKVVETPGGHGGYRDRPTYELLFDWFDAHRLPAKKSRPAEREP